MNIQIPAELTRITSKKDKTMSLGFNTQETTDKEKLAIIQEQGQFGYLMFSPNQFSEADIPKDDAEYSKGKSPRERLRSVIYIRYTQVGSKEDFNTYYNNFIEAVIDKTKALLD